jgi:hypothetical protein
MEYQWDDEKCEKNVETHGIHFLAVFSFDWDSALVIFDDRFVYNEQRFKALGMIKNRLHVLIFTYREQEIRVISLRKANKRELDVYEKSKAK